VVRGRRVRGQSRSGLNRIGGWICVLGVRVESTSLVFCHRSHSSLNAQNRSTASTSASNQPLPTSRPRAALGEDVSFRLTRLDRWEGGRGIQRLVRNVDWSLVTCLSSVSMIILFRPGEYTSLTVVELSRQVCFDSRGSRGSRVMVKATMTSGGEEQVIVIIAFGWYIRIFILA
jgi:hypothetical protein